MARRVLSYAAELGPSDRDPVRAAGSAERRTLGWETVLLLGVSLGASAVWSVLSIIEKLTRNVPLRSQTTAMNQSATPDRPWLDLAYQLAGILIQVVPVALALYLLSTVLRPSVTIGAARFIGFDRTEPAQTCCAGSGWRRSSGCRVWRSTSSPRRSGSTRASRRPTSPTCGGPRRC